MIRSHALDGLLLFKAVPKGISPHSHMLVCFRAKLIQDKCGVEITSDPKATKGKIGFIIKELGKLFVVKFHIVNRGQTCVYFTYYTALHKMRCFTLVDARRVNRVCPLLLCPGEDEPETSSKCIDI